MDGALEGAKTIVDPEEYLRSALEKIVFFECRVSQLESELAAAVATAERARGDAAGARQREIELEQALSAERGARVGAEDRARELADRVRLLETERERLLGGLVERARLTGATGADGAPGPEEGGADLAGFIAELRAEIEALRSWKAAAEAGGARAGAPSPTPVPRLEADGRGTESVSAVAGRFASHGRVGLTSRDNDQMKALLATRADRALYERSMDDLSASDPGRRLRAARALEALGSKAAAPLLAAALGREPEADVKAALLGALARFKEPFTADLAVRALEDGRPAVRVAALEALAAVAAKSAEERLAAALGDPSPLVRRRAALLLGFTPGEHAEVALAAALADPDRGVARAAAAALSGRPTARAQGALARGLEHPDASVRRAAATALGRVAGEAVEADAPAHQRRAVSRRIAERLAAMGGEEIRDAVLAAAPSAPAACLDSGRFAAYARHERSGTSPSPNTSPSPSPTTTTTRSATATVTVTATGTPSPSPSPSPNRNPQPVAVPVTRTATPAATAPVHSVHPAHRGGTTLAAPAAPRAAVAVLEAAPQASPADDLFTALVAEVRAALRGCTADDLAAALDAAPARVQSALAALASRGTLVQRGARWFMA